jgi:hypothetical protein
VVASLSRPSRDRSPAPSTSVLAAFQHAVQDQLGQIGVDPMAAGAPRYSSLQGSVVAELEASLGRLVPSYDTVPMGVTVAVSCMAQQAAGRHPDQHVPC